MIKNEYNKKVLVSFPDGTMKLLTHLECSELDECVITLDCLRNRFNRIDDTLSPNEKAKKRYKLIIKQAQEKTPSVIDYRTRQSETKIPLGLVYFMPPPRMARA